MMFYRVITILSLFFSLQNIFPEDFDKSLYQKKTIHELNNNWKLPSVIEYYKFDAVLVDRYQHHNAGTGNDFFKFFELNGKSSEGSNFPGPNTLPPVEPGQFVTVYFRLFPGSTPQGQPIDAIDHIEIPAEDFTFAATHKTIDKTNILFQPEENILLTIDSGVEVQVLGQQDHTSKTDDGKGNLIPGRWMWLVTSDGYGGWAFSPYLEPLPHTVAAEALAASPAVIEEPKKQAPVVASPPPVVVNEPVPAPEPEAEQASVFLFPLVIGLSVVLMIVIIVVVVVKRKKK